jgi:hypothetical protein
MNLMKIVKINFTLNTENVLALLGQDFVKLNLIGCRVLPIKSFMCHALINAVHEIAQGIHRQTSFLHRQSFHLFSKKFSFRTALNTEAGFFRNVGNYLPINTVPYHTKF